MYLFMNKGIDIKVKAIAVNIRNKREYRNYTQEYLAAKLAISQNAYSKLELGYTKITIERLFQIAEVLGFEVADLIDTDQQETHHMSKVSEQ